MSWPIDRMNCWKRKWRCLPVILALTCWVVTSLYVSPVRALDIIEKRQAISVVPCLSSWPMESLWRSKSCGQLGENFPLVLLTSSLVIFRESRSHSTFSFTPQECERAKQSPRILWLIIILKMSAWQMAIENTHNHADSCLQMCHMWSSNWIMRITEATSKVFQWIWNCGPLCLIFSHPAS